MAEANHMMSNSKRLLKRREVKRFLVKKKSQETL